VKSDLTVTPPGAKTLAATLDLFGVAPGTHYGLLLRDGRILCALPRGRTEALRILSLYQPQRAKAKLLATGFRYCAALGLHPLALKGWRMPSGSARENSTRKQTTPPGVMVGSDGHLCERAVVCLHEEGKWQVCKVAFGEKGAEILSHEAAMLRALSPDFPEIPEVISLSRDGEATLLRMPYQAGAPWQSTDLTPLLELLASWAHRGESRKLVDFPEWSRIETVLERFPTWQKCLADLAEMNLPPSIRHGDLTRPNLRIDNQGKLLVHDWERGSLEGLPGLDLVHFLIQDRLFRRRMAPRAVVDATLRELKEVAPAALMRSLGWEGKERELMALCFAFNSGSGYFDQTSLIDCLA
jgi:hypothetical protein